MGSDVTFGSMGVDSFASVATALVAVAAFGLSMYNTVRARAPRPHWEIEWTIGPDESTVRRDGIRFQVINQGRGAAHDVSIEVRPDDGEWDEVAHEDVMEFGSRRIVALDHTGIRTFAMVVWGDDAKVMPPREGAVSRTLDVRLTWREFPRTHSRRTKRFRTTIPHPTQ